MTEGKKKRGRPPRPCRMEWVRELTREDLEWLEATRKLGERYGGRHPRTITRWTQDPKLGFPQPFYIGRTPFWDESKIEAFERERAMPGRPVPADS
jgi:hypothetical protein